MNPKKPTISGTRLALDKANSSILTTIAVATVITMFCLVSSKTLLSQGSYQRRLLHERTTAVKQLKTDVDAASTLTNQYSSVFEGTSATNIIGGRNDSSTNAVPPNGDNASIVLDSLPSTYNFPALISSVTRILSDNSVSSPTIGGTDQSSATKDAPAVNPKPVAIQLSVGGQATYPNVQNVIKDLERSTRPFDVTNLQLSGNQSLINFQMSVTTYYQPAKAFTIGTKEVH